MPDDTRASGEPPAACDLAEVCAAWRLQLGRRRHRGRIGARRGFGPGSSLEFHDFRDYAPGDDLRHVDWSGYARSDQLRVRLHEAEVAPLVEVLVDDSPSMAVTGRKLAALRALVQALCGWARADGARSRVLALGGGEITAEELAGRGPAAPSPPAAALHAGSVRVLVTDALWREGPAALLARLTGNAARLVCLHLLDATEREPVGSGPVTLVDCEDGTRIETRLDRAALAIYAQRLARLCDGLRSLVHGSGGVFAAVTADALPVMCVRDLLPAGVVEPA
ncbi:MAG TPA: DUF58 domain-containing protein [bacterium]|nr:DUF58 domain-containing protein [bacterium]